MTESTTQKNRRLQFSRDSLPANHWVRRYRMLTSIDDLKSLRFWKAVAAEFLGTLLLVMVGCGSCIAWDADNKVVQIAFCFGLSVATIIWMIGHVSGGHINPAVTCAFFITRQISLAKAVLYIVVQCLGAIIGAGLLKGMTPERRRGTLGATVPGKDVDGGKAFGIEFFITFVLIFTIFATCDKRRKDLAGSFPLAIGLAVTMCHLFAVQFTGASMNTARSFGPAVVMGIWDQHWVYWLGPPIGACCAGLLYDNAFSTNASLEKARGFLLSSEYNNEDFPAKKRKIKVIQEETEELNAVDLNEKPPETA